MLASRKKIDGLQLALYNGEMAGQRKRGSKILYVSSFPPDVFRKLEQITRAAGPRVNRGDVVIALLTEAIAARERAVQTQHACLSG